MAPTESYRDKPTTEKVEKFSDSPLNYYSDQVPDIKPQLRKLDLELLAEKARDNVALISSALIAGGAVGFLLKRRPVVASCFAVGLVLQQVLMRRPEMARFRRSRLQRKSDREIERYALKAQLGDYGKLEVIPFK